MFGAFGGKGLGHAQATWPRSQRECLPGLDRVFLEGVSGAFAGGALKRGFDMVMLTSDLSCMIAGARQQLEELKAKTD